MIEIKEPIHKGRQCQCCYSIDDVYEINFRSSRQGSVVALCSKCRKKLTDKLNNLNSKGDKSDDKE